MSGVDLHTHTTASDGTYAPADLVREAVRRGVRVLAVTDHDSVDGVVPALLTAASCPPLEIVAGIEINTDDLGGEIHVLGYFLDYEAAWLRDLLREFRGERVARVHRMAARLQELGYPIDPDEVFALVQEGSAGRPHVAQVMVRRGHVGTVREAFDRFLAAGKPGYVPHRKVTSLEACEIIRRAGGLAVVAHPGLHTEPEAMVRALAGTGLLDGVECYYAEHSPELTVRLLGLCRELDLVPTGGSDFHGPKVRAATLGQPPVPWEAWEALRRRAGR
ncbi:MAG TPA: PHP domain-containing protein [Methylomirabilota bacterium]|nr:PHP domain-containing protein [Methylomirabilota bacterium]